MKKLIIQKLQIIVIFLLISISSEEMINTDRKEENMAEQNFIAEMKWDLSDLYDSVDDPRIKEDIETALSKSQLFEKKYKGKIANLTAEDFVAAIKEYEEIRKLMKKPSMFASLLLSANVADSVNNAFKQKIEEKVVKINSCLVFFELEWKALEEFTAINLMSQKQLSHYRYYLRRLRYFRPYSLSEAEEKMILEYSAEIEVFKRQYDEIELYTSLQVDGTEKKLSIGEASQLLFDGSNYKERELGHKAITKMLKEKSDVFTSIYNMILFDRYREDKLRLYPYPMAKRNLEDDIDKETIEALLGACKINQDIAARFYHLKKKIIGHTLKDHYRYVSLPSDSEKITWEECKNIILSAYQDFSPLMSKFANEAFSQRWIDAESRENKDWSYCEAGIPGLHPYILANYTENLAGVDEMAHEMGHLIHNFLSYEQGMFQFKASYIIQEMVATFSQILIFEKFIREEKNPERRFIILFNRIDNLFTSIFRWGAIARFEQLVHQERKTKDRELTTEELNNLFLEANREICGNSPEFTEEYGYWWMPIWHIYHEPFYAYSYPFGTLSALSIYAQYLEKGEEFVSQYIELLRAGGSDKPELILKTTIGEDIKSSDFWQNGFDILANMLNEAEKLSPVSIKGDNPEIRSK